MHSATQVKTGRAHILMAIVHYEPPIDIEFQILKYARTQNDCTEQLTKRGKEEVLICVQHQAQKHPFIDMLLLFQSFATVTLVSSQW